MVVWKKTPVALPSSGSVGLAAPCGSHGRSAVTPATARPRWLTTTPSPHGSDPRATLLNRAAGPGCASTPRCSGVNSPGSGGGTGEGNCLSFPSSTALPRYCPTNGLLPPSPSPVLSPHRPCVVFPAAARNSPALATRTCHLPLLPPAGSSRRGSEPPFTLLPPKKEQQQVLGAHLV